MQSKRQMQKENTREKIIKAAYQVYSKQGFSAATAAITKEASLAHGTLFAHFPSLEGLLCCLIEDFGNALGSEMHRITKESHSLHELLKAHLDTLAGHEDFYTRLITERSALPADAMLSFANTQSILAYHFNRVLEREYENQAIKILPVHFIFNTWIGLIHYYLENKDLFSPDRPLLERYGPQLIETFMELIKK